MNQNNDGQKPMVENISCILPETNELGGLFLGNVFGAQNAAILKEYGIRAMITASAETKISHSIDDIPFHLKIDAHDKDQYYIVEHINDCIHFIEQNRKNTNVYVHCYAGVSRSSAIVAAYLMWKYRWPLEKTLAFLVFKRVVAKPNDGFYNQLKEVETKLKIVPDNNIQLHIHNNNQPQRQQASVKPNSPPLNDTVLTKRPSSNAPLAKPQSPPLQLQNSFNPNGSGQQFYVQKGDPYMAHLQSSTLNRSGAQMAQQNHNHIPIPKVLAKRQQEPLNAFSNNDYYDQTRFDNKQKGRKSIYNDYMSPDVIPTSPKQNPSNKMSLGKVGLTQNKSNNGSYYTVKDSQSSLYTTNNSVNGINALNTAKRGFESQQKAKSGSRCIIRPKDLPGYKNY